MDTNENTYITAAARDRLHEYCRRTGRDPSAVAQFLFDRMTEQLLDDRDCFGADLDALLPVSPHRDQVDGEVESSS
jgi:hypothetical protein